jgi:hypothetical protein
MQRYILGTMLLEPDKKGSVINIDSVLEYPLNPVSALQMVDAEMVDGGCWMPKNEKM